MPKTYLRWEELSAEQRKFVIKQNGWPLSDYQLFMYPIRKDGQLYEQKGHHTPTPEYGRALEQDAYDAIHQHGKYAIRSKGDLRDWKPGHNFTFIKD